METRRKRGIFQCILGKISFLKRGGAKQSIILIIYTPVATRLFISDYNVIFRLSSYLSDYESATLIDVGIESFNLICSDEVKIMEGDRHKELPRLSPKILC